MELYATQMHFTGTTAKAMARDPYLRGGVCLRIGDHLLSSPTDTERFLPAAAIRFLRSLFNNHFAGSYQPLITNELCRMLPSEDGTQVIFDGIPLGVDIDILHENGYVIFRGKGGLRIRVDYGIYRVKVIEFARQIKESYFNAPQRVIKKEIPRRGYQAFMQELLDLLEQAKAGFLPKPPQIEFPSFLENVTFTQRHIQKITPAGIVTQNQELLSFREASYFFHRMIGGNGKYIGEQTTVCGNPCIRLYTYPYATEIYFLPERLPSLRRRPSPEERFAEVVQQLKELGYSLAKTDG